MSDTSTDRGAFREGVWVEWTSQSHGYSKTKVGRIVAIVPAGYHIDRLQALWGAGWDKPKMPGMQRDHDSYLIQVGGRRRLYWPRVSQLKASKAP